MLDRGTMYLQGQIRFTVFEVRGELKAPGLGFPINQEPQRGMSIFRLIVSIVQSLCCLNLFMVTMTSSHVWKAICF
jgi:hypothetical protein